MKILWLEHRDAQGNIIQKQENIRNLLHYEGEEFILQAIFLGGKTNNTFIPTNYFLGLDNRIPVQQFDTLASLNAEPVFNGYTRQNLSSSGGDFAVVFEDGVFKALSNIVAFTASGGSWGPVQNLFLCTTNDNTGTLISSATIDTPITVNDGESVTMRIGILMKDCA
jgi:hypothetical protein